MRMLGPAHAAGLMMCLPFLVPLHRLPLPSFESEWLAVALGMLAALALFTSRHSAAVRVPAIALAPLMLAVVVLLQALFDILAYRTSALVVCAFLLFAALLAIAARSSADALGEPILFPILAWWMLAGGCLGALAGAIQYSGLAPSVAGIVFPHAPDSPDGIYGNMAQQNHFATHLALAFGSAVFLRALGRLRLAWLAAVALLLVPAMALSGSRSTLLYLGWIGLCWCVVTGRRPAVWRLLAALLAAVALLLAGAHFDLLPAPLARLSAFAQGAGPRAWLWGHALTIFSEHPLLGIGADRFAYGLMTGLRDGERVWGIDQYAHNLGLQLLATTGLAGFAAVAAPAALLIKRLAIAPVQREHLWGWNVLGVLFIHAMLEQPLYYAYFLGVAAFAAGALDRSGWTIAWPRGARIVAGLTLCLGLGVLVKSGADYQLLATRFYGSGAGDTNDAQHRQWIAELHRASMFAPLMELIAPQSFVPPEAPAQDKLAFNTRLLQYAPIADVAYRQAALLAESGRSEAAKSQFVQAARAYPDASALYVARLDALAVQDEAAFGALAQFARAHLAHTPERAD